MTPDELGAVEALHQRTKRIVFVDGVEVGAADICRMCRHAWPCDTARTAAALREAWAERDAYKKAKAENDERFMLEAAQAREQRDEARAEVEKWRAEATRLLDGRSRALAAIARVRALCDPSVGMATACRPGVRHLDAADVRAAIDGEGAS